MTKKYHYLYKTVVPSTGQYYYGIHSTNNLHDGYQGSGALIRKLKTDNVHLITGIVEFCETRKEVLELEKKVVDNKLIKDIKCLNLITGGRYTPPSKASIKKSTKKKISIVHSGKILSDDTKDKISKKLKQHFADPQNKEGRKTNKGLKHTSKTKKLIAESSKSRKHSNEAKAKISKAHKNKTVSVETRKKQSAAKLGSTVHTGKLYITPTGTFRTVTDAAVANGVAAQTILNRCNNKNASKNGYQIVYT